MTLTKREMSHECTTPYEPRKVHTAACVVAGGDRVWGCCCCSFIAVKLRSEDSSAPLMASRQALRVNKVLTRKDDGLSVKSRVGSTNVCPDCDILSFFSRLSSSFFSSPFFRFLWVVFFALALSVYLTDIILSMCYLPFLPSLLFLNRSFPLFNRNTNKDRREEGELAV